jgi:hypothetical protein
MFADNFQQFMTAEPTSLGGSIAVAGIRAFVFGVLEN